MESRTVNLEITIDTCESTPAKRHTLARLMDVEKHTSGQGISLITKKVLTLNCGADLFFLKIKLFFIACYQLGDPRNEKKKGKERKRKEKKKEKIQEESKGIKNEEGMGRKKKKRGEFEGA